MANNRMYLVHKTTGKSILLAKYYPTPGWYQFHPEEKLNEFFEQARTDSTENRHVDYMWGNTDFELRFEIVEEGGKEIEL